MDLAKRQRLEAAGWKIGTVTEFLELTPVESEIIKTFDNIPYQYCDDIKKNLKAMTNTEILVLRTLYNKELSGLQIIQSIADIKGKSLDIGSFYPVFQKLEEKEFIKSRWETERSNDRGGARKRYYRLTQSGEKALADIQEFNNSLLN